MKTNKPKHTSITTRKKKKQSKTKDPLSFKQGRRRERKKKEKTQWTMDKVEKKGKAKDRKLDRLCSLFTFLFSSPLHTAQPTHCVPPFLLFFSSFSFLKPQFHICFTLFSLDLCCK
jgi:hypothetical protein